MRSDPFRFLRGSCHLFYEDLFHNNKIPQGLPVWVCGDLHIENFGSFRGADRLSYFDLNDFDEAILAPNTWEIVRLLCSVTVASQTLKYTQSRIDKLHQSFINGYASQLQIGKPMTVEMATARGLISALLENAANRKEKKLIKQRAEEATGFSTLKIDNLRAFAISAKERKSIINAVNSWLKANENKRKFKTLDSIYRIAGTGSIGIKRYLIMLQQTDNGKKFLLDLKQALPSSLAPFISLPQPAWSNEAARIIAIQNRMQHVCPGWLSATNINDDWFVLKEIQPISDKVNFIGFEDKPADQEEVLYTMGQLTASAQLRSSGRQGASIADDLIQFGINNSWHQSICQYANTYARQVKIDYHAFCKAFDKGYFR
jgi:uncharacterized protein (DUF2252 family)